MAANSSAEAASRTYIDSGCAITIINDRKLLHNIRQIKPIVVQGVAGECTIDQAGDLHLPAVSNDCVARTIIITCVLFDECHPSTLCQLISYASVVLRLDWRSTMQTVALFSTCIMILSSFR
eukprot:3388766-Rhodomonas_salina.1